MLDDFNFIITEVSDASKDIFYRNEVNKETVYEKIEEEL
jgi:hypothetical protein